MTGHQAQNEKVLDQFTKQAESYAKLTALSPRASPSPFLDALGPLRTDRVLDVACGNGRLTLMLANLTHHVTGIDLTVAMIDQGRALQAEARITNVEWQVGDVLPLPFPNGAFSLVVSQAAFHHIADPVAVLTEMARVCAQDGRIAINDLSPQFEKADAFNRVEKLRDPSHMQALPPAELRALGAAIGLVEITTSSYFTPKMPLEAVLKTSFPNPGDLEKVRALYRGDANSGVDTLGLGAAFSVGEIMIQYPMTLVVWRHRRLDDVPISVKIERNEQAG
jgi:ubiquinone/menaquinone biosynthesis C-methylase UbiE